MSDLTLPSKKPVKMRLSYFSNGGIIPRAGVTQYTRTLPLNDAWGFASTYAPWPYSRYKDLYDIVQVVAVKWTLRFDALRCTTKLTDNYPPQLVWARAGDDNMGPFPGGYSKDQFATIFSGLRGTKEYKMRWLGCTTNSVDRRMTSNTTIKGYTRMRRYYNASDRQAYSQRTDGRPSNYVYLCFGIVDPTATVRTDDIAVSIHATYYVIFKNPKDTPFTVLTVPGGRTQVSFPTLGDTETAEPTIPA